MSTAGRVARVLGAGDAVDGVTAGAVVAAGGGVGESDATADANVDANGDVAGVADVGTPAGEETVADGGALDVAEGDPGGVAFGET
jgi:hypothetical protein